MTTDRPADETRPLRDTLALDRTRLANERTFLAYVRTAIMLAATGATSIHVLDDRPLMVVIGWVLIGIGVIVALMSVIGFKKRARALR